MPAWTPPPWPPSTVGSPPWWRRGWPSSSCCRAPRRTTLLPAAATAWHAALTRPAVAAGLVPPVRAAGPRLFHRDDAPAPAAVRTCVTRMWELAAAEPAWDVRALLLHLAVLWIRPWPGANARLARLLLNTLRSAAGHRWLVIPATRRGTYLAACAAACRDGDARPFAGLVAAVAAR